jgi:hypothetical protein
MFLGSKVRPVRRADIPYYHLSRLSRQCGILNISQPYRPPRPVTGLAFNLKTLCVKKVIFVAQLCNALLKSFDTLPYYVHHQTTADELFDISNIFLGSVDFDGVFISIFINWSVVVRSTSRVTKLTQEQDPVSSGQVEVQLRSHLLPSHPATRFTGHKSVVYDEFCIPLHTLTEQNMWLVVAVMCAAKLNSKSSYIIWLTFVWKCSSVWDRHVHVCHYVS